MKNTKKVFALILSLVLILPIFGGMAESKDIIEIEFYTGRSFEGDAGTDLEKDNFVEQYIRERLGVDIKYSYADDLATNLNLRLLSNDIPDIMNIPNRNYLNQYAASGYLLNLDEHKEQLADAFAFTAGNAVSGKVDGVTYAIAGRPYGFRLAYWYNVNAFEEAGITEIPTTLEGYVDALRQIKANTADGIRNTIGLSGAGWDTLCQIFGAHGVTRPNVLSLNANGDVVDTMYTQEFYNALVYANGLWKEGLLDREMFSLTSTQVVDKAMTETAISVYQQWPAIKKVVAWEAFLAVNPNAKWEIVGPLTGPDGKANYTGHYANVGFTGLTAVNAELTGEKLDAALRLINFTATEEGLSLLTHGVEGTHWDYNAQGVPTVRAEAVKDINFSWIYQLCGREELSYCRVKFGEEAWKYVVQSDEQPFITDVTALIDDPEWYNGVDAETYISEECAKFLTGERPLNETEWDAFLNTLNSTYQYDKFIEAANEAWHKMVD